MRNTLVIILFAFSTTAFGQLAELGLFGGATNFMGDVGASGLSVPQGWVGGMNFRFQFNEHYGLRVSGNYGQIAAKDEMSSWESKKDRNLSFRSTIWEASIMMEINFFDYVTGSRKKTHSPYIFVGLGIFGFNPQAQYTDGEWYDLQPLSTEGQATSLNAQGQYGLIGLSLPFGIGYRWSIGNSTSIALEMGFRPTSTDYLDDASKNYVNPAELASIKGEVAAYFADRSLSQTDKTGYARANDLNNDWYVFTGIHLYVALTPKNERCSRF